MTFRFRATERTNKEREPQALVNGVIVTLHGSHPFWTNPVDSHNPFLTQLTSLMSAIKKPFQDCPFNPHILSYYCCLFGGIVGLSVC